MEEKKFFMNKSLYQQIQSYLPFNEQEAKDKVMMLHFMEQNKDYLERKNQVAHFTASVWTINPDNSKVLLIYHNIYQSWSWIGGHADGEEDLKAVALRELSEETGVKHARFVSEEIFSLESLPVNGHEKRGEYIPSHLHLNLTYLVLAEEKEKLTVKADENSAVCWFTKEEVEKVCTEEWMVERIYRKLIKKAEKWIKI